LLIAINRGAEDWQLIEQDKLSIVSHLIFAWQALNQFSQEACCIIYYVALGNKILMNLLALKSGMKVAY
tara:strand:+ start:367 stop:573 length:207 start_codon:yes stop_codon:yes gene_type:complete